MQAPHNETQILQRLQSFFNPTHTNNLKSHQIQPLPFLDSLFCQIINPKHSAPSNIKEQHQITPQVNQRYFANVLKYLSGYFCNQDRLFRVYGGEGQKMKIVDGSYFLDLFLLRVAEQFVSEDINQSSNKTPIRQVISYWIGMIEGTYGVDTGEDGRKQSGQGNIQGESFSERVEGMKLILNTMLSLPQIWLNLKMSRNSGRLHSQKRQTSKQQTTSEPQSQEFPLYFSQYKFMTSSLIVKYLSAELPSLYAHFYSRTLSPQTISSTPIQSPSYLRDALIHVLNKILMQTSFVSQLQGHGGQGGVWQWLLFGGMTEQQKKGRECFRGFLVRHFDMLAKKNKLIELVFYLSTVHAHNQQQSPQQQKKQQFLLSVFTHNYHQKKELYYIVESSSQLSLTHLKPSMYLTYYKLIRQIDAQYQKNIIETKTTGPSELFSDTYSQKTFMEHCLSQLAYWWSLNRDAMLPDSVCRFRYNLLAYMLERAESQLLQQYQNGTLIAWLSEGIQCRIVDARFYAGAVLVWSKLARTLEFEMEQGLVEADYLTDLDLPDQSKKNIENNKQVIKNGTSSQSPKQLEGCRPIQSKITPLSSAQSYHPHISLTQYSAQQAPSSPQSLANQLPFQEQDQNALFEVKLRPPQTLQDCILALQNSLRREVGFQQLRKLLSSQSSDVIFVWKTLIKVLMHPLQQQCKQPLKTLFTLRPREWIQDVAELYFKKDLGLNEKLLFIDTLQLGVNALAESPHQLVSEDDPSEFYFKRVSSRYYTEKPREKLKDQSRSRRWGYTRVAYEKDSNSGSSSGGLANSLRIFSNQPYVNRLYEIVSELFFKVVTRMADGIDRFIKTQPLYTQHVLNLLSTIAQNIKNYFDKYVVLEDIASICLKVLVEVQRLSKGEKTGFNGIFTPKAVWDQKAVSQIVLGCIQALNKMALSLDKFVPELTMIQLRDCVVRLKKIDIYSMRPLIEMVEANIYKNSTSLSLSLIS